MVEVIIDKDIFAAPTQTIVNTVNCVGAMGKGIALEYKKKYPKMYDKYRVICQKNLLNIGQLWLYKDENKWILNFPTKYDWKYPSKEEYLKKGLEKFLETYKDKGIESISFPLLGANNGKIDPFTSYIIMLTYLGKCDIPVFIYMNNETYEYVQEQTKYAVNYLETLKK